MNVGDYVRTNNGLIFKIVGGNEDNWSLDIEYSKLEYMEDTWLELYKYNDNGGWFIRENCKSSPNIIDLIEAGDYVNGYRIDQINPYYIINKDGTKIKKLELVSNGNNLYDTAYVIKENEIKSIVTREQFESMKYKMGE